MKRVTKKFSFKKRMIALILSLAMVMGVIYVGNKRERTVAADGDIP